MADNTHIIPKNLIAEIKFGRVVRCTRTVPYPPPPVHHPPIIDWFFQLGVFLQQEAIAGLTCLLFFLKNKTKTKAMCSSVFTGLYFGFVNS